MARAWVAINRRKLLLSERGQSPRLQNFSAPSVFMGTEPMGIDATIFSFVAGTLCPQFNTPLRTAAERYPNLSRYVGRMTARFYPDRREIACCCQMMVCAKRKIVGQIAPFTIRNLSGFLSRASIGNLFSQMLIAEPNPVMPIHNAPHRGGAGRLS